MYNVGTEYMYIQKTTTIGKMYNDLAELRLKREIHKLPYSYTYRRSQYNETFDLPDPRQRLVQIRDFSGRPEP